MVLEKNHLLFFIRIFEVGREVLQIQKWLISENCFPACDVKRNSHKLSWSGEEKDKVLGTFGLYIDTCEMPTVAECNIFIEQEALNRSIGQLRGFISNQIKKRKENILCPPMNVKKGMYLKPNAQLKR